MGAIMKNYLMTYKKDFIIIAAFAIFAATYNFYTPAFGSTVLSNFESAFFEMIAFIPLMFILIGLFEVWVPRELIERHIGTESGARGSVWVILLAMLQVGPLYGAFPVAFLLWRKGASTRNIFIYLGAFTTMKIPMLSFEIGFLGWRFSLMRTLLSLPVFIIIAVIMEKLFERDFEIYEINKGK
jgi:uncharacterized membrane protein YraQ (UPF0718 family)